MVAVILSPKIHKAVGDHFRILGRMNQIVETWNHPGVQTAGAQTKGSPLVEWQATKTKWWEGPILSEIVHEAEQELGL